VAYTQADSEVDPHAFALASSTAQNPGTVTVPKTVLLTSRISFTNVLYSPMSEQKQLKAFPAHREFVQPPAPSDPHLLPWNLCISNRQPERLESSSSHRKQTTATKSNRQLSHIFISTFPPHSSTKKSHSDDLHHPSNLRRAKKRLIATVPNSEFGLTNYKQRTFTFSNRNKNTLSPHLSLPTPHFSPGDSLTPAPLMPNMARRPEAVYPETPK
jgi:hypothetical protein